jgi:predicted O-linked N-acetylglucosamine transferase (SPINDLY family)
VGGSDQLSGLLVLAQQRRDAGDWSAARRLFGSAADLAPADASIRHNLALSDFALGQSVDALGHAEAAILRSPRQWQSHALAARIQRAGGDIDGCRASLAAVLAIDPGNGTARVAMADLEINEFGDAPGAVALVAPLRDDARHAADAELTTLMALLYERQGISADVLSERLKRFSADHLRMPPAERGGTKLGRGRVRVGLLSPLFSASPVHALTYSTFAALASQFDLVAFNRSAREDWATAQFRGLCRGWHDAALLDAAGLAGLIAAESIDVLFDLGGWSDAVGLRAVSARPARRIFTWVGGQSATTGLTAIDGWIGDAWQNPVACDGLYSEPVRRIAGGYVDYSPPPILASVAAAQGRQSGFVLAGNPVKIGPELVRHWPDGVTRVTLLDRRYRHPRTRARVTALLAAGGICVDAVIAPEGHGAYLSALSRFAAMVDTRPYGGGLTAIEAMTLGLEVISTAAAGRLFSERHQASHAHTAGRNPGLARQMAALITAP